MRVACIQAGHTRSVDDLVRAIGLKGVSIGQVGQHRFEIGERVQEFLGAD